MDDVQEIREENRLLKSRSFDAQEEVKQLKVKCRKMEDILKRKRNEVLLHSFVHR